MSFIKDVANFCKTCTSGDRLKAERVLFWLWTTPFNFINSQIISLVSGYREKTRMIQILSCEQALIKTNRKPIQNHQRKTLILLKTFTLEFEFDRHLKYIFNYQGMQRGFPVFLVGELDIFCKNDCLAKLDFLYFSNYKHYNHN